jgi:hypothetical protein
MRLYTPMSVSICLLAVSSAQVWSQLSISPNRDVQSLIDEWAKARQRGSLVEYYAILGRIEPIASGDNEEFTRQVVHYYVERHGKEDEEEERGMLALELLRHCRVPAAAIARALGGYLYANDQKLHETARQLFPFKLNGQRRGPYAYPDYSHLRSLVLDVRTDASISGPLKQMMFEFSPNAAFLLYHEEGKEEEVLRHRQLEREIANALYQKHYLDGLPRGRVSAKTAAGIRELAESKYWWSRMFAAEIMVQHKEFRDEALVEKLLKDEEPLVRQSVASIKTPDPLRASPVDK